MALSPQVDLLTDPRTQTTYAFTEDPVLAADLTNAMISAYQSTYAEDGTDLGWGVDSLAVQMKHFFANTANEGGRNYHDFTGKYTVVPEEQIDAQLYPFVKGGFALNSATEQVAAIMITYTVLCDEEGEAIGDNIGGAWNRYIYDTAAAYGFTGMISTDSISETDANNIDYSDVNCVISEAFKTGADQYMGHVVHANIVAAYQTYVDTYGQEAADANWKQGAIQCLLPIFRLGSFENPYVEVSASKALLKELVPDVTNELAQSSIVMVKNDGVITQAAGERKNVYIMNEDSGISTRILKAYVNAVETADEADLVVVFVKSPQMANTGYDAEKAEWQPISLQYRPYTADGDAVEEDSLTGDTVETQVESPYGVVTNTVKENRAYFDATGTVTNEADLDLILTAEATGKPVVVCVNATGAFCAEEFEAGASAILIGYGIDNSNFLPVISGDVEPSGLLPLQMPLNMEAVETQQSATPCDMACYVDAVGNTWDFAFGLNWSGVISGTRTEKYGDTVQVSLK